MTHLEHLADRLAAARAFFRPQSRRDLLESVRQLVEAAGVTGTGVTLNAPQAQALRVYLDSVAAIQETRRLAAAAEAPTANIVHAKFN